jgi:hypothetical protein
VWVALSPNTHSATSPPNPGNFHIHSLQVIKHLVLPWKCVFPPSVAAVAPFNRAPKLRFLTTRAAVLGRVVALQLW